MFYDLVEYIYANFDNNEREYLIWSMTANLSVLGAYLGFDYSTRNEYFGINHIDHKIIFNRGKVIVPNSEFRRFMDNAGGKYEGLSYEK